MPPGFDNRLGDNWALLFAIADHAGGEWPTKARKAAIKLSKVDGVTSIGVQALGAIKVVFDGPPDPDGYREPLERVAIRQGRSTTPLPSHLRGRLGYAGGGCRD
jgi:hypothetical protein